MFRWFENASLVKFKKASIAGVNRCLNDLDDGDLEHFAGSTIKSCHLSAHSPDIALSVNTSFIQFGFALGSGLGGLVISHSSILHLNWLGLGVVSIALLLALLLFTKMNSQ